MGPFGNQAVKSGMASNKSAMSFLQTLGWDPNKSLLDNIAELAGLSVERAGMKKWTGSGSSDQMTGNISQDGGGDEFGQTGQNLAASLQGYYTGGKNITPEQEVRQDSGGETGPMGEPVITNSDGYKYYHAKDRYDSRTKKNVIMSYKGTGEDQEEAPEVDTGTILPELEPPGEIDVAGKQEQGKIDTRMEVLLRKQKRNSQFAQRRAMLDIMVKARPQGTRFSFRR